MIELEQHVYLLSICLRNFDPWQDSLAQMFLRWKDQILDGIHRDAVTTSRDVGTCVRVGGQDQKWGAKDINFKDIATFFSNFG